MARFTRRKDEVERITALLESDDFDSAEQLAGAILQEAVDIIGGRHSWVLWSRLYPEVGWGPYWTEGQAVKAWTDSVGPALGAKGGGVIPVAPWSEAVYESGLETPTDVCICGHARWKHTTEGKRLYCGNRKDGCHCAGFTTP